MAKKSSKIYRIGEETLKVNFNGLTGKQIDECKEYKHFYIIDMDGQTGEYPKQMGIAYDIPIVLRYLEKAERYNIWYVDLVSRYYYMKEIITKEPENHKILESREIYWDKRFHRVLSLINGSKWAIKELPEEERDDFRELINGKAEVRDVHKTIKFWTERLDNMKQNKTVKYCKKIITNIINKQNKFATNGQIRHLNNVINGITV